MTGKRIFLCLIFLGGFSVHASEAEQSWWEWFWGTGNDQEEIKIKKDKESKTEQIPDSVKEQILGWALKGLGINVQEKVKDALKGGLRGLIESLDKFLEVARKEYNEALKSIPTGESKLELEKNEEEMTYKKLLKKYESAIERKRKEIKGLKPNQDESIDVLNETSNKNLKQVKKLTKELKSLVKKRDKIIKAHLKIILAAAIKATLQYQKRKKKEASKKKDEKEKGKSGARGEEELEENTQTDEEKDKDLEEDIIKLSNRLAGYLVNIRSFLDSLSQANSAESFLAQLPHYVGLAKESLISDKKKFVKSVNKKVDRVVLFVKFFLGALTLYLTVVAMQKILMLWEALQPKKKRKKKRRKPKDEKEEEEAEDFSFEQENNEQDVSALVKVL